MKVSDVKLNGFVSVNSSFSVFRLESFDKAELSDKDCYYLRYCLMRFILNNQDLIFEYRDIDPNTVFNSVDEESSICDNALCIGNFEGYSISETDLIKSVEMTTEGRVILNIYSTETDKYTDYLID